MNMSVNQEPLQHTDKHAPITQETGDHSSTATPVKHACNQKVSIHEVEVEQRPSISSLTCIDGKPIISIVAWSGSGKTTLFEQVVAHLAEQQIAVGIIKHHGHGRALDREGKDSWRYAEAGAARVAVASDQQWALFAHTPCQPVSLIELAREIAPSVDLILTEGYKHEPMAKIEFCRSAHNPQPVCDAHELIALITDDNLRIQEARSMQLPVYCLDDVRGISNLLMQIVQCAQLRNAMTTMSAE